MHRNDVYESLIIFKEMLKDLNKKNGILIFYFSLIFTLVRPFEEKKIDISLPCTVLSGQLFEREYDVDFLETEDDNISRKLSRKKDIRDFISRFREEKYKNVELNSKRT